MSAQSTRRDSVTAFVHVAVIPMDRERVLADQTVLIAGGRISVLGPAARVVVPAEARRIDGRGKFLMPGLADMHAHIARWLGDTLTTADVLFAFLANGVTTIRDMHSGNRHSAERGDNNPDSYRFALRRRIAAGELLGPRIYTAGDPDYSSPPAAAASVAELKTDGHDFVKISIDELWPDKAKPLYDSLIASAKRVGLREVGHVSKRLPLAQVFADHWASTEHMYGYREYVLGLGERDESFTDEGVLLSYKPAYADTAFWMRPSYHLPSAKLRELAAAARRAGVWTCPTLYISQLIYDNLQAHPEVGRTVVSRPVAARFLDFDRQIVKALQGGGAGLLLGTDAIYESSTGPGGGFTVHNELAALVTAGLTPYQALATGTRNVAEFLGTLDSTGTVAAGKRADLVLLSGNPLGDIRYTAGPAGIMVQGRWLDRAEVDRRLDAMAEQTRLYTNETSESAKRFEKRFYDAMSEARQQYWRH